MTPWVPAHPHTLRPEPKVAGRRERQRGNTSPAEGKGKEAAGNIGGFIRKYISNVSSCPCRARTIRIHLTQGAAPRCFALPWARFLLGFQPVQAPNCVVTVVFVVVNHTIGTKSPGRPAGMRGCLRDRRSYYTFRQRWKSLRHPRPIGEPHRSGNLRPVPPTGIRVCYRACNATLSPLSEVSYGRHIYSRNSNRRIGGIQCHRHGCHFPGT